MKNDELVIFIPEVMQCILDRLRVVEEIADHDDETARGDALGDFVKGIGATCVPPRLGRAQFFEDRTDLAGFCRRPHVFPDFPVESDKANRILLTDEEITQRGREVAGVVEF